MPPFFGSGPFRHTDLGMCGPTDPEIWSLGIGFESSLAGDARPAAASFPLLWHYEVPPGKKMQLGGVVVHASQRAVIGLTNFTHTRDGAAQRSGVIELQVDGSPVLIVEGRGHCYWEESGSTAAQYALCNDADLQTKISLHDGIQFTAGQDLTVEADIADPSHTVPGGWLSVARLRLWGKNTGSGAFMSIEATLRPHLWGDNQAFFWNGDETALSYEVPAGGFTWMGGSLRVEVGDVLISHNNLLYLNEQLVAVLGPMCGASGVGMHPIFIPFGGAEIYPGDRLELRGSPGPDFGQIVSAHLVGVEVALSTYPRSRVGTP